jgi:hypothetical protein
VLGSAELAQEPDAPDRPERSGGEHIRRLHGVPREADPDERGRAHEAARAQADADAAEQGDYHVEVPRFLRMWAEHEERWPAPRRAPAADRSTDEDGSFRSENGGYLSPERNAQADAAIARVRDAEHGISASLRAAERENTAGARLEGFDHRIKGTDRLKEKVAGQLTSGSPDATPAEVLRQLPDAIRYTLCADPADYTKAYHEVKAQLSTSGYEMYESRNSWGNPEYKGINTRWVTQEGVRFEVQFHTPDSFHAKQHITHESYERLRNPTTTDAERGELEEFQREVSAHVPVPEGISGIPDYKKKGF